MTDWPVKTIGEICVGIERQDPAVSGQTEFTYIDLSAVNQLTKQIDDFKILAVDEAPGRARQLVKSGDVLVSTVRPNLNTVALVGSELNGATASTGFCVLRPNKSFVEPGLLFAWVRNQLFIDELTSQAKGASYPAVTDNVVKALEIPVPPLEEQKRIVALLDAATARVAELTACYEQARTHANNLFTSALRDALESNPDWPVKTLGEVCDFVRGVTYDKADARSEMKSGYIPLLRATNITEKGLLREDFVFIPKNGVRADQKLMSGDALITIASGSVSVVGRSVLVEDPSEMTFGAFCGVLRPSPEILPRYLSHFMSSRSVRTAWSEAAQGPNINNLKRDDILQTECLLPSLSEQKRIVTRLDAMRAKTSEMVTAYDAKLTAAKNLRQSILESAFAGEL
jgi:type I restriction enzyme S subunit